MIGASFLVYFMSLDGVIGRLEAGLLFLGVVVYTVFLIIQSRREKNREVEQEYEQEYAGKAETGWRPWVVIGLVVAGLGLLVYGSDLLVDSAVSIARWLGLGELIIGLTIVAAGTSMPEVAASIAAAIKGERDIAVGNVIGSNLFNLFAVLGLSGLASPLGLPVSSSAIAFDIPVMIAVAIATLPILFTGRRIDRWEGWLFLGYYAAYAAYLILAASHHAALPTFNLAMVWFVAPLTLLTLVVSMFIDLRKPRKTA